eukprot:7167577-Prymnesium_polylepis.1
MVSRQSTNGQGIVKGLRQKASAHLNSVSAPLTFRPSAIPAATWSSITTSCDRLRRDASEHTVKRRSRGVALKGEHLQENG